MKIKFVLIIILAYTLPVAAQILTKEDSLNAGIVSSEKATVISGYGQAKVQYDLRYKTGTADLTRAVLFLGHKFNDKISLFTEMELEDGKVTGGDAGGEISMEQVFLKFNVNKNNYIVGGLFVPRIGIINENHLPTTFNGNDRPYVETFLIPATWRELGIGWYGNFKNFPSLNYSLGIMNGLNSAGFQNGSGIAEGRFEGRNASASNIAITGSLLLYINNFRIQASGYFGGSAGLSKRKADSLELNYGAFGTPVALGEFDIQYNNKGFSFKALGSVISIPDASEINRAYANNTAEMMLGGYGELGYNFLYKKFQNKKNLTLFTRYEYMDLNYIIPANGITNGTLAKQYIVTGITYQPAQGVAIKLDYVYRVTGEPNPALFINPSSNAAPYFTTSGFINLGIGYNF